MDRLTFSGYLERDRELPQVVVYREEPYDVPHPTPPCAEVGAMCLQRTLLCCILCCGVLARETCDVYRCHLMFRLFLRKAVKWLKVVENGGEVLTPASLPAR